MHSQRENPIRILFVCCGNACRSAIAESLAKRISKGDVQPESAGTVAYATTATDRAIIVMQEDGIDLSTHRPRDVSSVSLPDFDYIVAMDSSVRRELEELHLVPLRKLIAWDIDDPYPKGVEEYRGCRETIRPQVISLVADIEREHSKGGTLERSADNFSTAYLPTTIEPIDEVMNMSKGAEL